MLAGSIAVATLVLLMGTSAAMAGLPWPNSPDAPSFSFAAAFFFLILTFGFVGSVVASRLPRNPLGWIMTTIALLAAASSAAGTYAGFNVLLADGKAPLGDPITWLSQWMFTLAIIPAVFFIPLLFPDGRLPSRRWRAFAALGIFAMVSITLQSALAPWPAGQYPGTPNPYQAHGPLLDAINAAATLATVTSVPALLVVFASLVLRFQRSRGIEREQFKWFAYAAVLALVTQVASNLTSGPLSDTLFLVSIAALALVPIAVGVAILRYRLYDIDVVINRTLVYGLLVVVLAAVYAASVLILETVLAPVTQTNSLAVAVSTLVVAALFDPVRRRVRTVVDRRFYRRRYDSAREIAGFGSRLRDEVEPNRLTAAIAATLDRTVEPAHASIWLRGSGAR